MAWSYELLRLLSEHGVDFVIIGGVAAVTHGSARMTEDLDISAPLDHQSAVKIIETLAGVHPRWRMRPGSPIIRPDSPNLRGLKSLYLRTDLGQLDVLGDLPGVCTFAELADKTVLMDFRGLRCRVLDLPTLIAAKRFAGRGKDKSSLRELEIIQQKLREQGRAS
jgi:predicted nucleotidyltransferase